jgi:hypothetical protein
MFIDACMKSLSRKRVEDYVIIEGLRCLLSMVLTEEFKSDKCMNDARNDYVRSTIKLLDSWNDQVRDQAKDTSKKKKGKK